MLEKITEHIEKIPEYIDMGVEYIDKFFDNINNSFTEQASAGNWGERFDKLWAAISKAAEKIFSLLAKLGQGIWDGFAKGVDPTAEGKGGVERIGLYIGKGLKVMWEYVKKGALWLWEEAKNFLGNIWQGMSQGVDPNSSGSAAFAQTVGAGIGSVIDTALDLAVDTIKGIISSNPGYTAIISVLMGLSMGAAAGPIGAAIGAALGLIGGVAAIVASGDAGSEALAESLSTPILDALDKAEGSVKSRSEQYNYNAKKIFEQIKNNDFYKSTGKLGNLEGDASEYGMTTALEMQDRNPAASAQRMFQEQRVGIKKGLSEIGQDLKSAQNGFNVEWEMGLRDQAEQYRYYTDNIGQVYEAYARQNNISIADAIEQLNKQLETPETFIKTTQGLLSSGNLLILDMHKAQMEGMDAAQAALNKNIELHKQQEEYITQSAGAAKDWALSLVGVKNETIELQQQADSFKYGEKIKESFGKLQTYLSSTDAKGMLDDAKKLGNSIVGDLTAGLAKIPGSPIKAPGIKAPKAEYSASVLTEDEKKRLSSDPLIKQATKDMAKHLDAPTKKLVTEVLSQAFTSAYKNIESNTKVFSTKQLEAMKNLVNSIKSAINEMWKELDTSAKKTLTNLETYAVSITNQVTKVLGAIQTVEAARVVDAAKKLNDGGELAPSKKFEEYTNSSEALYEATHNPDWYADYKAKFISEMFLLRDEISKLRAGTTTTPSPANKNTKIK